MDSGNISGMSLPNPTEPPIHVTAGSALLRTEKDDSSNGKDRVQY